MEDTDRLMESVGESIGYAREYISQQLELTKLEAAEKIALISSHVVRSIIFFILGLLVFTMGSISIGLFLGDFFQSYAFGFFIIFIFYLLLFFVVYITQRRFIINPILNFVLDQFRNADHHE